MQTRKTTRGTRTKLSTFMADLRSEVRFNLNNFNSKSIGFVFNELSQLEETPITYPIIHSLSTSYLPDSFEVFQDNLVSIKIGNNLFAYVMVNPRHPTVFSTRQLHKKPFTGTSAFCLKNGTQISKPSFTLLDFGRIIKSAVRTDGKIIYSEVNAKNFVFSRVFSINLFGKGKEEVTSLFSINQQKTFSNIPSKVFLKTIRNSKRNFYPSFDCGQRKNISFNGSRTWKVISHGTFFDDRLGFSLLDDSTGLFDTSNSKLAPQASCFDFSIDKRMKLDVILNLSTPSLIDAELKTFFIQEQSSVNIRVSSDFNFGCCSAEHTDSKQEQVFKGMASPSMISIMGIRIGETL